MLSVIKAGGFIRQRFTKSFGAVALNDNWRTPSWLVSLAQEFFGGFDCDLAADDNNAVGGKFFTKERSAFQQHWTALGRRGWCNPPYSEIDPWLFKALEYREEGFSTTFLIPTPNGDKRDPLVLSMASDVVFLTPRIAFVNEEGRPVTGNPRGSCLVPYEAYESGPPRFRHEDVREKQSAWKKGH